MRRWSPVVALLAAALALAACGGGEGEDEIVALRSEAAGLEAEIDDLGSEVDALREEVSEGGERVAAAEARAAEAGVALGGVEREVEALAREVDEGWARQEALAVEVSGGVEAVANGLWELSEVVNERLRGATGGLLPATGSAWGPSSKRESDRLGAVAEVALEEGDLAAAVGAVNGLVVAVRGFAEALGALAPPPAVGGAHAEAVASSAGLADLIVGLSGEIAGVTTFEDLEAAFEEFAMRPEVQAAGERLDAACVTLQDLAQEFEINVDIRCD